jgi:hypothetical protein
MSFEEILAQVAKVSKGQAQIAADSYAGSLDKLSVASANVAETLGKDLVDALAILGGEGGLPKTLSLIESMSGAIGTAIIYAARFARVLDIITGSGAFNMLGDLNKAFAEFEAQDKARAASKFAGTGMATSYQGKKAQDAQALAAAKKITNEGKKTAAAALATAKAKQLSLAIDKANLALSKGADVFDLDKIQLNAALIGQAEALGKATTGSQILAIANDVQRLKVKQDINALEDAIASKDEAAILKATAKLNEDLKILGALQRQDAKLLDINKVLAGMKSTDLINLANLQAALDLLAKFKFPSLAIPGAVIPTPITPIIPGLPIPGVGIPGVDYNPGQNPDRNIDNAFPNSVNSNAGITYNPTQNKDRNYDINITVNAGAVGDENIIVDAVQNAMNEIARRGYLTTYAGAIAV